MNDTIKSIATLLKDLDGILIFPHVNMDGDALGSATALCLALRQMGKKVHVMINEPIPKNLDFLDFSCTTEDDSVLDEVQLSLMLDCNGSNRIPGREEAFNRGKLKGCIDHHQNKSSDIRFDFVRVEPKTAATGEIVYNLIKALGVEINLDIANCIFTAITTDTGNFQHSNTTRRSHDIVGHLYNIEGFNSKAISALIYDRKSKEALKMESIILANLNYYDDGRVAVGRITQSLLNEVGCTMDESEGIVQHIMSIEGVEVGCLIKESEINTRASLRARTYANVEQVARKFGGGGHILAAGCNFDESLSVDDAEKIIVPELIKAVHKAG